VIGRPRHSCRHLRGENFSRLPGTKSQKLISGPYGVTMDLLRRVLPPAFLTFVKIAVRYRWVYRIPPQHVDQVLGVCHNLVLDCGYFRSCIEERCTDANGNPIPWYTYPAIEYLSALDFSDKDVFEYGSGASSIWWGSRSKSLTTIEHVPEWYERVGMMLPANAVIALAVNREDYVRAVRGREYDVIIVDGMADTYSRLECCIHAIKSLRHGGIIVLDNSDWLPLSCDYLRNAGLLQVDFNGFVPGTERPQRTSIFFAQPSRIGHKAHRPAAAGWVQNWEDPAQDPFTLERVMRSLSDDSFA